MKCSISDCQKLVFCKGVCKSHYYRMRYAESVGREVGQQGKTNTEKNFWSKVIKTGSCWYWTAGRDQDGYGIFSLRNRSVKAHRYAWSLLKGSIRDCVLHRCDNPSCVNPDHLFLGTPGDNSKDRDKKGRQVKGEKCHTAVLNDRKVLLIRKLAAQGSKRKHLAKRFKVSVSTIDFIVQRRSWKHI